jgi:hypothetical protein
MRRTGHIRQRSPGSWELRYSLGADPGTGKRRVITTTFTGDRRRRNGTCADLGQVWHETEGYFGTRPPPVSPGLRSLYVQSIAPLDPIRSSLPTITVSFAIASNARHSVTACPRLKTTEVLRAVPEAESQ